MLNQSASSHDFLFCAEESRRLDQFVTERLPDYSRSFYAALIKNGLIRVNQQQVKAGYRLRNGDRISVTLPVASAPGVAPEPMPLTILFEDEYLLIVNKPAGLVVHPGAGNTQGTLVSGLLNYTRQLSSVGGPNRPGLVHRLDKDTSGVLIVAKSNPAHWRLSALFAERKVEKEYRAIVWGLPDPSEGIIDAALRRSPANRQKYIVHQAGRSARTRYRVVEDFHLMAEVALILETGRTHQARVHLAYLGHPVVGDRLYGGGKSGGHFNQAERTHIEAVFRLVHRQLLHAWRIRFRHPFRDVEIEVRAPLPEDFVAVGNILRKSHG